MPESTTTTQAAAPQTTTTDAVHAVRQPDNRAGTIQARGLQQAIDGSPRQVAQRQAAPVAAARPNRTGLPDTLKAGVENLSGHSLDDVRVHYGSARPAGLQAHAYAQGTDIHVAPGQEQHLPHEAWHVVQQMQGRVPPTAQLKGIDVNDDSSLEQEADVMGRRALAQPQRAPGSQALSSASVPATTAPVQRRIARPDWDNLLEPNLSNTVGARLTDGPATAVQRQGGELKKKVGKKLEPIGNIDEFLGEHSWNHKLVHVTGTAEDPSMNSIDFSTPERLDSSADFAADKVPMNVEELSGDRHAFVHHSYSTYSTPGARPRAPRVRREAGHHLTVENAHLLAMLTLQDDKTLGNLDKTALTKPDVNKKLKNRGITEIDNLNFFPKTAAQQPKALGVSAEVLPLGKLPEQPADTAAEAVDERLSLADYLKFIQTSIASMKRVPAVYGAKILHTAQVMQTRTGLNPAAMFLKVGKGDQRHLLRVALTIAHKGLAAGFTLPAEMLTLFEHYITNTPKLPATTPVTAETEWVPLGAVARDNTTTYNALETRYVEANYGSVVAAMKTYIGA